MDEVESGGGGRDITRCGVCWPGGELNQAAACRDVQDAVSVGLHTAVDVAVEYASDALFGGQEGGVQLAPVLDAHVAVHPGGVQGQGGIVHEDDQRRAVRLGFLASNDELLGGEQALRVDFCGAAGI